MKEVLCVRGGLRGPLRHLLDKLGQVFRRSKNSTVQLWRNQKKRSEILNALEQVTLRSFNSWKLMLQKDVSFTCLKAGGEDVVRGDKH